MSVSILFPPRRHLNKMFSHFTTRVSKYIHIFCLQPQCWHGIGGSATKKTTSGVACLLLLTYGCNFHSVDMQKKTLMVEREKEKNTSFPSWVFRKWRLCFKFSPYSFGFFLICEIENVTLKIAFEFILVLPLMHKSNNFKSPNLNKSISF